MTWTHIDNYGEKNPSYKNSQKYNAVHAWVRRRLSKPSLCDKCKTAHPVDIANISGQYLKELTDWEYLCRKCHMESDGRNQKLREFGKSRKFPDKLCSYCLIEFHPVSMNTKYCSRDCYFKFKVSKKGGKGKVQ
jgi:hypothetical protein